MIDIYLPDSSHVIHETKVDFSRTAVQYIIHLVQFDRNLPIIKVHLRMNDRDYVIPSNADIKLRWGKKDGTFTYKDVLGCDKSRTIVYFNVDEQMTLYFGEVNPILELVINHEVAGSSPMFFNIERNPIQGDSIKSANEYQDAVKLAQRWSNYTDEIAENSLNRHSHSNKKILDAVTANYTAEERDKLNKLELTSPIGADYIYDLFK